MYRNLQGFLKAARNIPCEVRSKTSWLNWRYEVVNGRKTKVPYVWHSPTLHGSSTDPKTWGTFQQVMHGWYQSYGKAYQPFDGVGLVLHELAGIDLDNSVECGVVKLWADDIVDELPCYWEISPSKNGLKGFFIGNVEPLLDKFPHLTTATLPRKKPKHADGAVEIYGPWSPRFFTVTGNKLPGSADGLVDCQKGFQEVFETVFRDRLEPPKKYQAACSSDTGYVPNDVQIILKLAWESSIGPEMKALYQGRYGKYGSASEARFALLAYLSFWTGPRPELLDAAFRSSALHDLDPRKWQRLGASEIGKILAHGGKYYDWRHHERRAERGRLNAEIDSIINNWTPGE